VGGIEAEAGMLGQPVYFLTPDVVGVNLTGQARAKGVTATDLVLTVTEMLRKAKVVGKFVEFFGEGTASLAVPDRADARQHGARVRRRPWGFFPVDDEDHRLHALHRPHRRGKSSALEAYFKAQEMFGVSRKGRPRLLRGAGDGHRTVRPSVAGPQAPAGPHRAWAS
jgi:aconitate hydratase